MGWYKVPRMSFDYTPATVDTILTDRGVKEPEERKVATAFERDARTMSLISSFSDMAGAVSDRIIKEALQDDFPQRFKDILTSLADMEVSRGHTSYHSLALASTLDANLKLLRRQGVLDSMSLQPHLKMAAYRLPFSRQVPDSSAWA